MNEVLRVTEICKEYPGFRLDRVSFSLERGSIMGFIGANGAGKTTTLKCLLNLCHPQSGKIEFFGMSLSEHEKEIKGRVGYASGGVSWYPRRRIRDVIETTRRFYPNWDEALYRRYLERFSLDESKKPMELSEGMKVKLNLAIALSHHAELLILDEPTSGLDPVSRDDLLEVFLDLAAEGTAILFSTHITSDLDKCADSITYIQNGRVIRSEKSDVFVNSYRVLDVPEGLSPEKKSLFLGVSRTKNGQTALIRREDLEQFSKIPARVPDLEEIMVHLEKGKESVSL